MLHDLHQHSLNVGLRMNKEKTKIMTSKLENSTATIEVDGHPLEGVKSYVYLGQLFSLDEDSTTEIKRKISSAWSKFGRLSRYLQDVKFPFTLKGKIFNPCVMPVFLYGAETWTTTKKMAQRQLCPWGHGKKNA